MPNKYQIKAFLIRLKGFLMSSLIVDIVFTPMFAATVEPLYNVTFGTGQKVTL